MKVTLLCVGKTNESHIDQGIQHYIKRILRYMPFEIKVIPDLKASKKLPVVDFKRQEGERIMAAVDDRDVVVLLDEKGKEFNSVGFANWLGNKRDTGTRHLVLVIGGAYGFSEEVYKRANGKVAFSQMTMSHQLIRLVVVEQLYRANSILAGDKYHH